MKILYCRVGWMNSYCGINNDSIINGGSYNKDNIGLEIYNYHGVEGKFYGFVEPGRGRVSGRSRLLQIERLGAEKNTESVQDVLVVWVAKGAKKGQYIVGWYKNATVYRDLQDVPSAVMKERDLKDHSEYNIYSENVTLLEPADRVFLIQGIGQSNIWYGNEVTNNKVIQYIDNYDTDQHARISAIEKNTDFFEGRDKEALVKIRINQDKFRNSLIQKYGHCCLCSINNKELLVASHIKPWSKSNKFEKLDPNNGLLLCPNHDKLFDLGLISFTNEGKVLISDILDDINCAYLNITEQTSINVTEENARFLKYHRENVFKDEILL